MGGIALNASPARHPHLNLEPDDAARIKPKPAEPEPKRFAIVVAGAATVLSEI
jgi:hypothetical protein